MAIWGKEQTEPIFLAEIRSEAKIRNQAPIYKFWFRQGQNRNLITNFGFNQKFWVKLKKTGRKKGHLQCEKPWFPM